MCGRGSLNKTERELEEAFGATFYSEDLERYNPLGHFNIAPTHWHPILTQGDPSHWQLFRWGLVPSWADSPQIGSKMINARLETVAEKPAFRKSLQDKRCIIPFDAFYEWQKRPDKTVPYRIFLADGGILGLAGLWSVWQSKAGGDPWYTFTILTRAANQWMGPIHDRMPVILDSNWQRWWLESDLPPAQLLEALPEVPESALTRYPIGTGINAVKNNEERLILPVDDSQAPPLQGSLF